MNIETTHELMQKELAKFRPGLAVVIGDETIKWLHSSTEPQRVFEYAEKVANSYGIPVFFRVDEIPVTIEPFNSSSVRWAFDGWCWTKRERKFGARHRGQNHEQAEPGKESAQ